MAKKQKSALSKKVSLRPAVKQIERHIKQVNALKARATPAQKKKMDVHIKKLRQLRAAAMDQCDLFFLNVD